jgi:hypothetical protein
MLLFALLGRLFDLLTRPFLRGNSLVPYTERLRELIAADVDDLRNYGAYYASTPYGVLAAQTSESLRAALRRDGVRDVTLQAWADCRDSFGEGTITALAATDPGWMQKLTQLSQVAAQMAHGV